MAEIKLPTMSYKEIGEKGARYALDEVEYKGLTIRQWADKITGGEYAPVVHGHWILEREPNGKPYCFHCSACDEEFRRINIYTTYNYCPNCGAKMDEEEQHDKN